MSEWVNKLHVGNVIDVLKKMPGNFVDTVVTSPPYWGLRDYGGTPLIWDDPGGCDHQWGKEIEMSMSGGPGHKQDTNVGSWFESSSSFCEKCGAWKGSLGLEPTPDLYVKHLVDIFREIKRILKRGGTLWLNLGDSYATHSGTYGGNAKYKGLHNRNGLDEATGRKQPYPKDIGLKHKDLVGIPWMTAFALRSDGWYLRNDIIWNKPNPMPESVTDRATKSHEYIFLFAKNKDYYFDQDAVREKYTEPMNRWGGPKLIAKGKSDWDDGTGQKTYRDRNMRPNEDGRNIRSVWTIVTKPYFGAHFATYPEKLVEPCIKAGTSEHGCCPKCGEPWQRIVTKKEREEITLAMKIAGCNSDGSYSGTEQKEYSSAKAQLPSETKKRILKSMSQKSTTIGWEPTCNCGSDLKPVRSVVFDPFMGSGTTAKVAIRLNRDWCGTELNPEYAKLIEKRLSKVQTEMF